MFHDFHLLDLAAFNFYAIENSRLKRRELLFNLCLFSSPSS